MDNDGDGTILKPEGAGCPVPFPVRMNDAEVLEQLDEAAKAGRWMVVAWYIKDGRILLFRKTHDFPTGDLEESQWMLGRDVDRILGKEKQKLGVVSPDESKQKPDPATKAEPQSIRFDTHTQQTPD